MLRLTSHEIAPAFNEHVPDLIGNMALHEATMQMVRSGRQDAFLIPIVDFVTGIALDACIEDDVFERLPKEVNDRSWTAAEAAIQIVDTATRVDPKTQTNFFIEAYYQSEVLREGLKDRGAKESMLNATYLGGLCSAPFREVSQLAGGAERALRLHGVSEEIADIVSRSRNLLAFAGVARTLEPKVQAHFGQPYASPELYEVSGSGRDSQVGFTPEAISYLREHTYKGGGCPASRINPADGGELNMLKRGWQYMVEFMLSDGATVSPTNDIQR
jgi:hypothetical protein